MLLLLIKYQSDRALDVSRRVIMKPASSRNRAIRKGKHMENVVERYPRYHIALNDHLNYKSFKKAEYLDDMGREYKVATSDLIRTSNPRPRSSHGPVKLYVRLPPGTEWFPNNKNRVPVTLHPLDPNLPKCSIIVRERFIMQGHRTGHVFVSRTEWIPLPTGEDDIPNS